MHKCPILKNSKFCITHIIIVLTSVLLSVSCTNTDKQQNTNQFIITNVDSFIYPQKQITAAHIHEFTHTYPTFAKDFLYYILGIDSTQLDKPINIQRLNYNKNLFSPVSDSLKVRIGKLDKEANLIKQFLNTYQKLFNDDTFNIPATFAYTAPIDAPAIALFSQSIGINLTLFAGSDFILYKMSNFQSVFPKYLHHRLEKKYIPFLVLQQILMDRYPSRPPASLVEAMMVLGRYWYVMKKIVGGQEQYICMYTASQLRWCQKNEANIWLWMQNVVKDIYTKDISTIRDYIGEAPYTQGMSKESPGNLGPWIGMQIVEKFMEENSNMTLPELMQINPYQLFQQSMYNPK